MKQTKSWLSVGCIGALCVCFFLWSQSSAFVPGIGVYAAAVSAFLFCAAAVLFLGRLAAECAVLPAHSAALPRHLANTKLMGAGLCFFVLTLLLGMLFDRISGHNTAFFELFLKGDAFHYIKLAKNGYVNVGDARFHIVFFPLYPLLVRIARPFFGSFLAAGMAVSLVCFCAALPVFYRLALCDLSEPDAFFAALSVGVMPASFFFFAPMTESVFLLCGVCCALATRKGRLLWAGFFGLLAALCRAPGVGFIVLIGLFTLPRFFAALRQNTAAAAKIALGGVGAAGLTAVGFLLYLWLNAAVTGNPFQFSIYQKEHWSQGFGWFFSTAAYQLRYAVKSFANKDFAMLSIWLPGLLCQLCALLLLVFASKKLPAALFGWALAYFAAAMGATWLLSAPRYLAVLFVLPLCLAGIRPKWLRVVLTFFCAVLGIFYFWLYMAGYPIY